MFECLDRMERLQLKDRTRRLLRRLGRVFNPGFTSQGGNRFPYTCMFGFIDMGHFFISALESYVRRGDFAAAYRMGQLMEIFQESPGGTAFEALTGGVTVWDRMESKVPPHAVRALSQSQLKVDWRRLGS